MKLLREVIDILREDRVPLLDGTGVTGLEPGFLQTRALVMRVNADRGGGQRVQLRRKIRYEDIRYKGNKDR